MIVIATITASLLAACTAGGSTHLPSIQSSPSARSAGSSPARACTDATVRTLVIRFLQAFNLGDQPTLQQLWAEQGDGFDWYSTDAPGQRIRSAAKDRAGLERYFAVRHAAGESLRLISFQFNGNAGGYGNFQYALIRRADDLPPTAYTGKGAAICGPTGSMLGVWSMAKTPTPPPSAPATNLGALGQPGCRPPSPINRTAGFPEVQGTSDQVQMWGLIMAEGPDNPLRTNEQVKIVWRITGSGALHLVSIGPDGRAHPLQWGPDPHLSSTYTRPGDEWGAGYRFTQSGCWTLRATRGTATASVWLEIGT